MTALPITEQVVYRALAGRIAAVTDPQLPQTVFSNRIGQHGAGWRLRPYRDAYRAYREFSLEALKSDDCAYVCVTDIANFYPSLHVEVVVDTLRVLGACEPDITVLEWMLTTWRDRDDLVGLPIGGHGSGVVSNPTLLPIDRLLGECAAVASRYGDDMTVIHNDPAQGSRLPSLIDGALHTLGLRRNIGKTREFFDMNEARATLERDDLVSLDVWGARDSEVAAERLSEMWEELSSPGVPTDPSMFRFVLAKLSQRGMDTAAFKLACRLA